VPLASILADITWPGSILSSLPDSPVNSSHEVNWKNAARVNNNKAKVLVFIWFYLVTGKIKNSAESASEFSIKITWKIGRNRLSLNCFLLIQATGCTGVATDFLWFFTILTVNFQ
jgi:hypothetical protein